jgi:uncharacterized protein DUF2666
MDDPDQYIDFMAKYKDWISIKRMGIRPNTRPEEVVFHMAGIRNTIDAKAFGFLGINTSIIDNIAVRATQGKKKSYSSLSECIMNLNNQDTKKILEDSCGEKKELVPIAEIYLIGKVLTNLNFDSSISQLALSKIYKDLKIKKPKGRIGGGKAKEESD